MKVRPPQCPLLPFGGWLLALLHSQMVDQVVKMIRPLSKGADHNPPDLAQGAQLGLHRPMVPTSVQYFWSVAGNLKKKNITYSLTGLLTTWNQEMLVHIKIIKCQQFAAINHVSMDKFAITTFRRPPRAFADTHSAQRNSLWKARVGEAIT